MPFAGALLEVAQVTKRYESPDSAGSLTVLDSVSFNMTSGESLAIVGPSGSGKSTLLHIIGTLDHPSSGTVASNGRELNALDEIALAAVRNRKIGFVFQSHYLLPHGRVFDNVIVPMVAKA